MQTDEHGKRKKPVRLCVFGFFCGIAYGWFMNLQYIIGYVDPINWKTIGLAYAQSLYFDISHGVCTALVLYLAAEPWTRKLMRHPSVSSDCCTFVDAAGADCETE